MSKRKIQLGMVSLLMISSIFVLSGCGDKNQNQDQNKDQQQTKTQDQTKAQDGSGDGENRGSGNGERMGAPAEMTEACADKSEGDACSVTMAAMNDDEEEETIEGTCKKMGNSDTLSCTPSNMPQGGPGNGGGNPPSQQPAE